MKFRSIFCVHGRHVALVLDDWLGLVTGLSNKNSSDNVLFGLGPQCHCYLM